MLPLFSYQLSLSRLLGAALMRISWTFLWSTPYNGQHRSFHMRRGGRQPDRRLLLHKSGTSHANDAVATTTAADDVDVWKCRAKNLCVSTLYSSHSNTWPSAKRRRYAEEDRDHVDQASPTLTTPTEDPLHRWGLTSTESTAMSGLTPLERSRPGYRSGAPGDSSTRTSYRKKVSLSNRSLFSKSSLSVLFRFRPFRIFSVV